MASEIDFSRLRRQLFETPDITQGGIMGEVDFTGTSGPDFGAGPYYGEGPPSVPQSSFEFGGMNFPEQEFNKPFNDPRGPVNPSIAPPIGGPGSSGDDAMQRTIDAINRIYRPEYTSRDRLNRLLDNAPEREGPGVMRGLAAFGMGLQAKDPLDALKVHEQALYAPHHREMADWTAKTGPFGNAAQYENTANINERTLAGNVVSAQTAADRLAENARQADQKNEVAMERNRLTALKNAMGRGWIFDGRNGSTIIAHNLTTGESKDTGITTNWMTEADKIAAESAGDLAVQQSRNQGAMAVQQSRNAGALAVQTLRNQGITGNGGTRGLLPSQQKQDLYNRAERWLFEHPEDKQWVTLDPSQDSFDVDEPGTSMFGNPRGMPPDRYDAFISNLYSGGSVQPAIPQTPAGAAPQQQGAPQQQQQQFQTPRGIDPRGRNPQLHPELQQQPQAVPQAQAQPPVAPRRMGPQPAPVLDPFMQGGGPAGPTIGPQPSQDPFAQPETTNFGPGITGALGAMRGSLRPPQTPMGPPEAAPAAPVEAAPATVPNAVVIQRSNVTGQQRISVDGGKTWSPYNPQAGR